MKHVLELNMSEQHRRKSAGLVLRTKQVRHLNSNCYAEIDDAYFTEWVELWVRAYHEGPY